MAKALYRYPTTSDLHRALQSTTNLRRICGFGTAGTLPSEATFSRAFATFAAGNLGNVVHDALVAQYLSHELFGHISRDSTAIVGREKPAKKAVKEPAPRRKRGRPAIGELPTVCDRGTKQNAKGNKISWNVYKLHLDTNVIGLPISALVTSAPLHISQVAIALIKLTSNKATYLYDLMDAAYDAQLIKETSRKFGHVPIADRNGRGKEAIPRAPHEAERYKIRSCAELANSRLNEDFGASNVMVKGTAR